MTNAHHTCSFCHAGTGVGSKDWLKQQKWTKERPHLDKWLPNEINKDRKLQKPTKCHVLQDPAQADRTHERHPTQYACFCWPLQNLQVSQRLQAFPVKRNQSIQNSEQIHAWLTVNKLLSNKSPLEKIHHVARRCQEQRTSDRHVKAQQLHVRKVSWSAASQSQ